MLNSCLMVFVDKSTHTTKLTNHYSNSFLHLTFRTLSPHHRSSLSDLIAIMHPLTNQLGQMSTIDMPCHIWQPSHYIIWISVWPFSHWGHVIWVVSPCYVLAKEANCVKLYKTSYIFEVARYTTYHHLNPLPHFCTCRWVLSSPLSICLLVWWMSLHPIPFLHVPFACNLTSTVHLLMNPICPSPNSTRTI